MIAQVMWIVSMAIVGGLVGLHQCWRRQAADAVSCMIALGGLIGAAALSIVILPRL